MHSFNKAAIITGCFILAVVFLAPPTTQGDEWNLATRFTVNHPFEVPGMVLQPNTPYVIRLYDSPSTRNVVQLYNESQTHMLTMFMAISDERLEPADKTVFTFIETQPGFPLPIKEWFYPGRLRGLEFVYPKQQALEIAKHAREPVLAADNTNLHRLSSITVESIGPIGTTQTAVTESAANVTKSENTAVFEEKPSVAEAAPPPVDQEQQVEQQNLDKSGQGEIAQNTENTSSISKTESEVQQQKPSEVPATTERQPVTEENRELPRTAGEVPLLAMIGALCLAAGLGLRVLSAKS